MCVGLSPSLSFGKQAEHKEYVFFKDTQYPLKVHVIQGEIPGPTVMIQGGIQGDEDAGFISAQLLTRTLVHKGTLIIVPRADVPSIHIHARQFNVDLNRRFDRDYDRYFEDRLARVIRFIIGKADAFIHLHEGSGFYNPVYIDQLHSPKRYGQSVIIDTDVYQDHLFLAQLAKSVLAKINQNIVPKKYAFRLFNTRTFSISTPYPEQQKSLSFYAVKHLNIPALAIEVSKNIRDLDWKVKQQMRVVGGFLQEFGLSCTLPDIGTDEIGEWYSMAPSLRINGVRIHKGPIMLNANEPFSIALDTNVSEASGREYAVYASEKFGYNLLGREYVPLHPFRSLSLITDGKKVARIPVLWKGTWSASRQVTNPMWVYSLNDSICYTPSGGEVDIYEGDQLILEGIWEGKKDELLNIKGFISDTLVNTGQDKGVPLLASKGNFMQKYLSIHDGYWEFRVVRETSDTRKSTLRFRVFPRSVKALELRDMKDKTILFPASAKKIKVHPGTYRLSDIWTPGNPQDTLVIVDGWPVSDDPMIWNPGESHLITLYGARDFKSLHDIQVEVEHPVFSDSSASFHQEKVVVMK